MFSVTSSWVRSVVNTTSVDACGCDSRDAANKQRFKDSWCLLDSLWILGTTYPKTEAENDLWTSFRCGCTAAKGNRVNTTVNMRFAWIIATVVLCERGRIFAFHPDRLINYGWRKEMGRGGCKDTTSANMKTLICLRHRMSFAATHWRKLMFVAVTLEEWY